jgi:hypothetical protein
VRLVSGGQSIAAEATALLGPDLVTLAVKEDEPLRIARPADRSHPRVDPSDDARRGHRRGQPGAAGVRAAHRVEMDFAHTHMATWRNWRRSPRGRRGAPCFVADDYLEILRAFRRFSNLSCIRD